MFIPCLYLQTCTNINEIKGKRCAIFIRLDKHFWALVCSERGSLQTLALAQAAQAGEADVLNCQEDLPACHPQDCRSTSPHNFKTHSMRTCALHASPNKFPPFCPPAALHFHKLPPLQFFYFFLHFLKFSPRLLL